MARSNLRRRERRRDWILIMRRGFFLVRGDTTPGPYRRFSTIPFLSVANLLIFFHDYSDQFSVGFLGHLLMEERISWKEYSIVMSIFLF